MTRIHANMKLSDLVEMNFEIVAVIQRLEIPYGFKEKTVSMVCKENGIDVDFFLQLAQWFNDRHYSPQDHLIEHSPEWLIIYLRNTHHCYLTYQIPRIEKEIALLEDYTDLPDHSAKLMIQFFREYIREFSEHIEEEEIWTFPYTIDLISTLKDKMSLDEFHEKYQGYSCPTEMYVCEYGEWTLDLPSLVSVGHDIASIFTFLPCIFISLVSAYANLLFNIPDIASSIL